MFGCGGRVASSWVFGLGRGTAVPLEILGRGTSGCGPRALRRSRAGGGGRSGPHGATFFIGADRPDCCGRGRTRRRAPKIMSDGRRASRWAAAHPAEVLQRVWWAGDGKGGDRDRPQAVSQVRAPRHAPWTQRAAPKLGTDVPQHPQKTARTLVRLLRASEALWASCTFW